MYAYLLITFLIFELIGENYFKTFFIAKIKVSGFQLLYAESFFQRFINKYRLFSLRYYLLIILFDIILKILVNALINIFSLEVKTLYKIKLLMGIFV